jgi:hypothetical protein
MQYKSLSVKLNWLAKLDWVKVEVLIRTRFQPLRQAYGPVRKPVRTLRKSEKPTPRMAAGTPAYVALVNPICQSMVVT